MKKKSLVLLVNFLLASNVYAANASDEKKNDYESYCRFVMQKAEAKAVTLNAPELFARYTQSEDKEKFVALGASKNLQDFPKKDLVLEIANNECELYRANLDVREYIKYITPTIEKNALLYKLSLFKGAKQDLDKILAKMQKQVDSKNETVINLFNIESQMQKVEMSEQQAQIDLAKVQYQLPYLENTSLPLMLDKVRVIELKDVERQRNTSALEKKDNWDVNVLAGVKRTYGTDSLNDAISKLKTYYNVNSNLGNLENSSSNKTNWFFGVNATYNLGTYKSNKLVDSSDISYKEWKLKQKDSLAKEMQELKQKLVNTQLAEKEAEQKLLQHQKRLDTLIDKVKQVNSADAIKFKSQLEANKIAQNIEIEYLRYKIKALDSYIK